MKDASQGRKSDGLSNEVIEKKVILKAESLISI